MRKEDCPLSKQELDAVVYEIEGLLSYGSSISQENASKPAAFFDVQASTIFSKGLMSLVGFLRFIPPSHYYADKVIGLIDLSSASVLGRQLMHDATTFFYLTEASITDEELQLRVNVWNYHGVVEASAAAALAAEASEPQELSPEVKAVVRALEESAAFRRLDNNTKGRIRKGQQPLVLSNQDILTRRGISKHAYLFSLKAFSNFVHPSALSVRFLELASGAWDNCYQEFYQVICYVAGFSAEIIQAFVDVVPDCRQPPARIKKVIDEYRPILRGEEAP
jgi:hypothetical protein